MFTEQTASSIRSSSKINYKGEESFARTSAIAIWGKFQSFLYHFVFLIHYAVFKIFWWDKSLALYYYFHVWPSDRLQSRKFLLEQVPCLKDLFCRNSQSFLLPLPLWYIFNRISSHIHCTLNDIIVRCMLLINTMQNVRLHEHIRLVFLTHLSQMKY